MGHLVKKFPVITVKTAQVIKVCGGNKLLKDKLNTRGRANLIWKHNSETIMNWSALQGNLVVTAGIIACTIGTENT